MWETNHYICCSTKGTPKLLNKDHQEQLMGHRQFISPNLFTYSITIIAVKYDISRG